MRGATRLKLVTIASTVVLWAGISPVWADLNPGDNFQNPDLVTETPHYTSGLPSWYTGSAVDTLSAAVAPPSLGTPFVGIVRSEVYYVNGVDGSGGIGFAYKYTLDPSYHADGMESASYSPGNWSGVTIFDTGSDGSGSTTDADTPGSPPAGFTTWTDGDPYTIRRDTSTGAPELRFTGVLGGTTIEGGQSSAIIWFETDAPSWTRSIVSLLDGGVGGSAFIFSPAPVVPEPAGIALGLLGLSAVYSFKRRYA